MILSDELLTAAAAQTREMLLDSLPTPQDCHHDFSQSFERKMQRLRRQQPVRHALRRAAAIFLAALVGMGAWLTVDTEARAAFFQWCKEIYETHIVYRFSGEQQDVSADYRPGWLPEGYAEAEVFETPRTTSVTYTNSSGEMILLHCGAMQQGATASVVSESAVLKAVTINGLHGELYLESDPAKASVLTWFDDTTGFTFTLSARLSESNILHIAESISLS